MKRTKILLLMVLVAIQSMAQTNILNDIPDGTFNRDSSAVWVHAAWWSTQDFSSRVQTYKSPAGKCFYGKAAIPYESFPDGWGLPTKQQWDNCLGRYSWSTNDLFAGGNTNLDLTPTGYYNSVLDRLTGSGAYYWVKSGDDLQKAFVNSRVSVHPSNDPNVGYAIRLVWQGEGEPGHKPEKTAATISSDIPEYPEYLSIHSQLKGLPFRQVIYLEGEGQVQNDTLSLEKGWNYVTFTGVKNLSPQDLFEGLAEKVIQMKDIENMPFGTYIPAYGVCTIKEIENKTLYMVNARQNLKILLRK